MKKRATTERRIGVVIIRKGERNRTKPGWEVSRAGTAKLILRQAQDDRFVENILSSSVIPSLDYWLEAERMLLNSVGSELKIPAPETMNDESFIRLIEAVRAEPPSSRLNQRAEWN